MPFTTDIRLCSECGTQSAVVDSRPSQSGVRRRRTCERCNRRWTTFEVDAETWHAIASLIASDSALERTAAMLERQAQTIRHLQSHSQSNTREAA